MDGHFGSWSEWKPCTHVDGSSVGICLCRTRLCDNPVPKCGGRQCEGSSIEIVNCSRYVKSKINNVILNSWKIICISWSLLTIEQLHILFHILYAYDKPV